MSFLFAQRAGTLPPRTLLSRTLAVLMLGTSLALAQSTTPAVTPLPATTGSQTIIPGDVVSPAPGTPATVTPESGTPATVTPETVPAPVGPVNVPTSLVLPGTLSGVSARLTLSLPRGAATGPVAVQLELSSALTSPVKLSAVRDHEQNCAFAPSVRVLRVGTREVVYPAGGPARLCAQDIQADTLAAGGKVQYSRTLQLAPGDYMVEGWWLGLADGHRVKVPAQPVRLTVK